MRADALSAPLAVTHGHVSTVWLAWRRDGPRRCSLRVYRNQRCVPRRLTDWDIRINIFGTRERRSGHMPHLIRSAVLNNYVEVARSVGLDPYRMIAEFRLPLRCLT